MGRIIYAEDRLLEYLKQLGGPDIYTVGLILGQSTAQKDFVVHLARTLPVTDPDVVEENLLSTSVITSSQISTENYLRSIKDLDVNVVADHAKHVTRMLPGGMWILGIFVVGPGDCLSHSSCVQKLKMALAAIYRSLASNEYLYGNSNYENIILSFNSTTSQYTCKSVEVSAEGILKPADWKFQKKATKWHHLEALVNLNHLFPISDKMHPHTLKRQLQTIVTKVSDMISSALIVIEGESRSGDELIETIGTKKKNKKDKNDEEEKKILQVGIYLPCVQNSDKKGVETISCSATMRLKGQLVSRTALHQKATIEEATNAVKQDILRSLASRLELHWDSVIEEENGSPEENLTLHEPPRRVLVQLPQSKVAISDYLFPGEGPQASLALLKELLDLDVLESQVQKDVELQVDPSEFYCQNEVKRISVDSCKETVASNQFTLYVAGVIIAFIIAIVGILIHQLYLKKNN